MKKILYSCLFFCLAANVDVQAQRRENIVKLGLIEPFYSSLGMGYERFIPETNISIQASGSLLRRNVTIWESLRPKLKGFSGEIQGRYYYPTKGRNTVSGIYNGVFFKYAENKITMQVPEGVVNFLDGKSKVFGLFMGYQKGFNNRLFIDATLGSGFHKADYSGRFSERGRVIPSLISSGFVPKFDLKAGIAF
jgi:hypothetical protein